MSRRGRPPTPTHILIARGTFRQDRHGGRPDAPQPPDTGELTPGQRQLLDETPPNLSGTARQAYVECVHAAHWLAPSDRTLLTVFVNTCERHRIASDELGKRLRDSAFADPQSETAAAGQAYARIVDRTANLILKLADELLFTPTARARAGITFDKQPRPPKGDNDPWRRLRLVPKPDGIN